MQINNIQVGNYTYPLVEGQLLPIAVGETIKVSHSFKYMMPETTSIKIWASLYVYNVLGQINRKGNAQTKGTIALSKALDYTLYNGEIDIIVGSLDAGKYGLLLELPDYPFDADHEAHIDDCIQVSAAPNMFEMIIPIVGIMLMVGLMSAMMPTEE